MNDFYQNKAAVPREARNGNLHDRLLGWRDKRLLHVADVCAGSKDSYRQSFGKIHEGFANTVDEILTKDNEVLENLVLEWIEKMKSGFNQPLLKGPNRDALGLCGAELIAIFNSYKESQNEPT